MATRVENLTEVATGVFELRLPIPWEDEFVNVFLLAGGGHVDLIDCGMNSAASIDTIRRAVRSVGGEGARVRRLLITHIHPDHYGAAGILTAEDGAELCLHRLEVPLVHPRYLDLEQLIQEVGDYLTRNGVPDAVAELVGEGEVTAWALAIELWGDRPHFFEKRLALQEALAHLQSLAVENRLQKLAERDLVTWRRPRPRPA